MCSLVDAYVQVCLLNSFNAILDGQPDLLLDKVLDGMLVDYVITQVMACSKHCIKDISTRDVLLCLSLPAFTNLSASRSNFLALEISGTET